MENKAEILELLRQEKERWQELLASLSLERILAPDLPGGWSIKDVVAHLMVWQKRTNARLDAAAQMREPVFPPWPGRLNPDTEEPLDETNAWIYQTYRDLPWPDVYREWQAGFQKLLDTSLDLPEADLLDKSRYPWLEGYSMADVLMGSYEHHHIDHLQSLQAWLREHGLTKAAG